jgi:hypothetical protein
MPPSVARQREILSRMLGIVELEPALRWFELGCSLGRGAGDELSDIDCAVGVDDVKWKDALTMGALLATAGGSISDGMRQVFPGRDGQTCWHIMTLYDDGAQVSCVLMPASWRTGLQPGSIALYDPDGVLVTPTRPPAADVDATTVREWLSLGWLALGDLAKYLDRDSLWEAYQRLDEARSQLWKVWNAGSGIDFPSYGLASLLDEPAPRGGVKALPPHVESTVARLDATDLRRAALATADLLTHATLRVSTLITAAGQKPPDGMRRWVLHRITNNE